MAPFCVGGGEVIVENGQSVIPSLTVVRRNLFYMINWNNICVIGFNWSGL
jgi:hypothetical protein